MLVGRARGATGRGVAGSLVLAPVSGPFDEDVMPPSHKAKVTFSVGGDHSARLGGHRPVGDALVGAR
jgi:hypothetical protein